MNQEERVPGFVYLDMDRVQSITARLDKGFIIQKIDEEKQANELGGSLSAAVKSMIPGVPIGPEASANASVSANRRNTERSSEAKALHHYYFTLLEEWLKEYEGEWFHDINQIGREFGQEFSGNARVGKVKSEIKEGDIIRATGDMELLDFSTGSQFLNNFFDSLEHVNKYEKALKELSSENQWQNDTQLSQEDSLEIGDDQELDALKHLFQAIITFMPDTYEEMLAARIFPFENQNENKLWALLQEENLESPPMELLSKYQEGIIPDCTVVAGVDTITTEEADTRVPNRDDEEMDFGTLSHMTDDMAVEFGFKVDHPSIAISPIAIYR